MIDLAVAFRVVARALDEVGLPYVVVGSTAAAAWGVARGTRDVDVVTTVGEQGSDVGAALMDRLTDEDTYVPREDVARALVHGGAFNVLHPGSGGKIDVFVRRADDEFTRSRLERRVPAEVLGVATWVATPEVVILAKLRWRLGSRSEVQWRDCVEIAATQTLDTEYLWAWAPRLAIVDDLTELLSTDG